MIVLDANVLIAYLDKQDQHHISSVNMLSAAADNDFAVSALNLSEVLVRPAMNGTSKQAIQIIAHDLDVLVVPILGPDAVTLALIRAETRLRMPDCCVLLAADKVTASSIMTFDDQLAQAVEARGLSVTR
ncbi:type II toxin-antitoxin system VapC family toxin [Solihabitans fulvus]|uniref:type II toxin-antitoxin system VapC family toxin n=1 Tax=Solihabitans fulvus TaxID=1892852 RepID=UPI001661A32D|nr:type II toxin-antitoxin system VapC family toxin [Solihabitans fulvus]